MLFRSRTYAGLTLYLYLSRYRSFPGQRTDKRPWREWVPILTGKRIEDYERQGNENVGTSWRYFSRDIINKALAEVNSIQDDYVVSVNVAKAGVRVTDVWFTMVPVAERLEVQAPTTISPAWLHAWRLSISPSMSRPAF